jgi:hypothetical protein
MVAHLGYLYQTKRETIMRKVVLAAAVALAMLVTGVSSSDAQSQGERRPLQIKTRLDHLSGTNWVLVISYLPSEITSITCESWTMLGTKSWNDQNNFTIPSGPSVAIMNAKKFNGYCKQHGSIIAHTDDGDAVGTLDRGDGNWDDSTKLTFLNMAR